MAKFQIVAVSTRTGERTNMTTLPLTRAEAETMLSKLSKHPCRDLVIEEVAPAVDPGEARQEMAQCMTEQAAVWRALCAGQESSDVYADKDGRLVWLVPGRDRAVGMQVNPNSGRPMVMAGCGLTKEELAGARIAFNICPFYMREDFKPTRWGDYCELHAKGCESAAEYILTYGTEVTQ